MSTKAIKNGEYTPQEIMVLEVSKLNKEGAVKAVNVWGQPKSKITHLVFYTTSRRDMPGPDHHLTKLLGRTNSIQHFQYQHGRFHEGTVLSLFRDFANKSRGCGHALVVCSAFKAEDSPRSSEKLEVTKHQPSRTNTACRSKRVESHSQRMITTSHSKRVESHSQGMITTSHSKRIESHSQGMITTTHSKRVESHSQRMINTSHHYTEISTSHHAQRTSPLQRAFVKGGSSGEISTSHHAQRTNPLQRSIAAAIGVKDHRSG